jgi:pectinesterase
VVSTFETKQKEPLTAAIGISYSSTPEVISDVQKGYLALWESYQPRNGELGSCIIAKPKLIEGFSSFENERFMLLKIKSGQPVTYYVGAGWTKSPQFKTKKDWLDYINSELKKLK